MREMTVVQVPTFRHRIVRPWRLVAVAFGLGMLAVLVPDDAASRWVAVSGLAVLALAGASVVLVRRAGRHVRPSRIRVGTGPTPAGSGAPAVVDELAGAVSVVVVGAVAPDVVARAVAGRAVAGPAVAEPAVMASVAPVPAPDPVVPARDRAELLAAGGDALHELQAEAAWARKQRPVAVRSVAVRSVDGAEEGLPSQRGTASPPSGAPGAPPLATTWVPLGDDVMPSLRSGWPFS